jgi:hypothetical protein
MNLCFAQRGKQPTLRKSNHHFLWGYFWVNEPLGITAIFLLVLGSDFQDWVGLPSYRFPQEFLGILAPQEGTDRAVLSLWQRRGCSWTAAASMPQLVRDSQVISALVIQLYGHGVLGPSHHGFQAWSLQVPLYLFAGV